MKTAVLKMWILLSRHSQRVSGSALEPGLAWVTTPEFGQSPQVAGSVADAAPSACATSARKSETWQWDSKPQLFAPLAPSLLAAEVAVSSKLEWQRLRRRRMRMQTKRAALL